MIQLLSREKKSRPKNHLFLFSGVQHKVKCDTVEMTVELILPDTVTDVYLEGMKEYGKDIGKKKGKFNCTYLFFFPASHAICVPGCQPMMEGHTASFRLSIGQFYRCGMTKVVDHTNVSFLSLKQNEGGKKRNHWTFLQSIWLEFKGHRVYYHRIVVEDESHEKESILVKCGWMPHHPQRITGRSKRQADELSPDFVEET